ncbi:MAG: M23 family metallopeptidase [Sphingomicrobium sp.]
MTMIGLALFLISGQTDQSGSVKNKSAFEMPRPAIEAVVVHPPVAGMFECGDHSAQESLGLGDALGTDCSVVDSVAPLGKPRGFLRPYRTDGLRNEDWFGWGVEVLAPFDGKVVKVYVNAIDNRPGTLGKSPASSIVFERSDGMRVLYAHIMAPTVRVGEMVKAGMPVAKMGNNGLSWSPHVHIGAWKGEMPLQIRFDQIAMGER